MAAAKEIIIKQQTKQVENADDAVTDKIESLNNKFETKISELESKMGSMEAKIDLILRKMTKY